MDRRCAAVVIACLFAPLSASAQAPLEAKPLTGQIVITEIMYDLAEGSDGGREWIEVYNASAAPIPLANWKVFENGTNHKITGSGALAPGAYAVIADNAEKFKADWPGFASLVFDSAFSLSNEGETLALRDAKGTDGDSATFTSGMGGNGTGDSLQRSASGAAFEAGVPTPGAGIPAGGLQKSPPKQTKSAQKAALAASAGAVSPGIIGEPTAQEASAEPTKVGPLPAKDRPLWAWLLGPFFLALSGSAGIVWSRRLKRDEWDIIEETGENG